MNNNIPPHTHPDLQLNISIKDCCDKLVNLIGVEICPDDEYYMKPTIVDNATGSGKRYIVNYCPFCGKKIEVIDNENKKRICK